MREDQAEKIIELLRGTNKRLTIVLVVLLLLPLLIIGIAVVLFVF